MVVIKIQNKTDIRRITVDIVPKYEELLSLARNLFGSSLPSQFVLKYTDEDADKITVSSDRELEEAFKVMNKLARFEVVATKTARPPMNKNDRTVELDIDIGSNLGETVQNLVKAFMKVEGEQPTAAGVNNNNNEAVHYGVTCDGCGVYPIRGLRLKCSTCPDYDLCEKCHKQNIHSEHKLTSIPPRHHAWNPRRSSGGCPYFKSRCAAPTTTTATTTVPEPKQEVNPESAPIEVKSVEVKEPVEEVKPVVEVKPIVDVKPIVEEKPVEVKTEVKPVEVKPVEEVKPVAEVKEQVPEPVHPFADKLKQLEDMGFSDKTKNIELLLKNKGDLVRAVTQLLNSN